MAELNFGYLHDIAKVEVEKYLKTADKPTFAEAAPHLVGKWGGENVLLYKAWKSVGGGSYLNYVAQGIGDCFPAGTMVRMADGTEKPIEQIQVGDEVVTHKSGAKRVTNVFTRKQSGAMITFESRRFRCPITATPNHRFAVRDGDGIRWVRADLIDVGDCLIASGMIPGYHHPDIDLLKFLPEAYSIVEAESDPLVSGMAKPDVAIASIQAYGVLEDGRDRIRMPGLHYASSTLRHISITPALGRLVGLYLAEGGVDLGSSRVTFSFARKEEHLVQEVIQLVRDCFGIVAKRVTLPSKPSVTLVHINNKAFCLFWHRFVGHGIDIKRVPGAFMSAPDPVRHAVLSGWLDGDGYFCAKREGNSAKISMSGTSISFNLVRDMALISASLGLRFRVAKDYLAPGKRQPYTLHLSGEQATSLKKGFATQAKAVGGYRIKAIDKNLHPMGRSVKVTSIEVTEVVALPVYDLEVEDDHSFVANGYVVHNCSSFGFGHGVDLLQAIQVKAGNKFVFEETCTEAIYGMSRCDIGNVLVPYPDGSNRAWEDGSTGIWTAQAISKLGTIPRKIVGTYSGDRAKHWGAGEMPADIKAKAGAHKVRKTALIRSFQDAADSIMAGYPVAVCSSGGFPNARDKNGFIPLTAVWWHCMLLCGVRGDIPGGCLFQSWGPNSPQGPLPPEFDMPSNSFWVSQKDLEDMLRQGDSWAIGDFDGYPEIDLSWFIQTPRFFA